jgi:hypothetical protein
MDIADCGRVSSLIHRRYDTSYLMSIAVSLLGASASSAIQERHSSPQYLDMASAEALPGASWA